jgi:predicted phosphodiesterase
MGNKTVINIILASGICCCFSACEKIDFKGMFIPYESPNSRFEQSMEWNAKNPYHEIVVPSDDYMIYSMGDSHVGGTKNLDAFLANAASSNVTAVVMVGDITTGRTESYEVVQEHLSEYFPFELYPVVGNHDLYFKGWEQFYSRFGSSTYKFSVRTPVAADLFICLDSGSGTLGNKQIAWLKNILEKERPEYRRCVLFTHNNLFRLRHAESTSPLVEELHILMELFVRHRVDMVITGHDHKSDSEVFGNTTHIIMDALMDDNSDAGYLKVKIKDGKIEFLFVKI